MPKFWRYGAWEQPLPKHNTRTIENMNLDIG